MVQLWLPALLRLSSFAFRAGIYCKLTSKCHSGFSFLRTLSPRNTRWASQFTWRTILVEGLDFSFIYKRLEAFKAAGIIPLYRRFGCAFSDCKNRKTDESKRSTSTSSLNFTFCRLLLRWHLWILLLIIHEKCHLLGSRPPLQIYWYNRVYPFWCFRNWTERLCGLFKQEITSILKKTLREHWQPLTRIRDAI